ncbi:MAG: hypothetical protein FJ011_04025 [Chloroflexi bacterium]|nr:hypothetical protein [Chloroflexota bacterium]
MSNVMTYAAQEVRHLIIEEMAGGGQLRGTAADAEIEVIYQPGGQLPQFVVESGALRFVGANASRVIAPAEVAVTVKHAQGDLRVYGLKSDVTLEAVAGDLRLSNLAGVVRIAQVDGDLRGDEIADLRLMGGCAGDVRCENIQHFEAENIGGDLRLLDAGDVRLGRVHGDVWVEKAAKALQIARADGDMRLSDVGGMATLRSVAGDLRAEGLAGGLTAPRVAGDAVLAGPFTAADGYTLVVDGDLSLYLPADASVRLAAKANGRIRSDPQLTPATDGIPTFTASLGDAAVKITVSSGGDLRISQRGDKGPAVETGRRPRWDAPGRHGLDHLGDLGERIRQQVRASLAAAGISIDMGEATWLGRGPKAPRPPRPPTPERPRPSAAPGATAQEQLAILKMVESGTITAAEAEQLLKALETD